MVGDGAILDQDALCGEPGAAPAKQKRARVWAVPAARALPPGQIMEIGGAQFRKKFLWLTFPPWDVVQHLPAAVPVLARSPLGFPDDFDAFAASWLQSG